MQKYSCKTSNFGCSVRKSGSARPNSLKGLSTSTNSSVSTIPGYKVGQPIRSCVGELIRIPNSHDVTTVNLQSNMADKIVGFVAVYT